MGRSASPRAGERRSLIACLRNFKRYFAYLESQWTIEATLFDFDAPRDQYGNIPRRPRRADEFPENKHENWVKLASDLRELSKQLDSLAEFADLLAEDTRPAKSEINGVDYSDDSLFPTRGLIPAVDAIRDKKIAESEETRPAESKANEIIVPEYADNHKFRSGGWDWCGNVSPERCAYLDCDAKEIAPSHDGFGDRS